MKPKKFKFRTPQQAAMETAKEFINEDSLKTDTQGWYTGEPEDGTRPVQDADDL